jgi:hypothetical protein
MDRPTLTVGDIFRRYGEAYRRAADRVLSTAQRRVMTAIAACRTAALGGHVEQCDHCGHTRVWYNSCRNRHCPSCQSLARAAWIENRTADLLDCEYFHVVFTVPQAIAEIAAQNKAVVYGILFRATADTLRTIAADPRHLGAAIGFFAVLHTWGQTVMHHPHLHCVVPGGGLSPDGTRWIACRPGFFLPVRVLSRLFRRLFLQSLQEASDAGQLYSPARCTLLPIRRASPHISSPRARPTGSCMRSGPSPVLTKSWSTSAATRTAWRSPTSGCSTWTTATCASAIRTTAPIPADAADDDPRRAGIHPALSLARLAERLPPHPLLRLAWPSPPHGNTRPMPAPPRDGPGATDRWPDPVTLGLSRSLRVSHRRLTTGLSCLCGWAHDRDGVSSARAPVLGASRYLMTPTHAPRTAWIRARAARDGTRVIPAPVTRPEDSHYGAVTSLADPRVRRPSLVPAPVTPAAGPRPTSSSTPASIQSP